MRTLPVASSLTTRTLRCTRLSQFLLAMMDLRQTLEESCPSFEEPQSCKLCSWRSTSLRFGLPKSLRLGKSLLSQGCKFTEPELLILPLTPCLARGSQKKTKKPRSKSLRHNSTHKTPPRCRQIPEIQRFLHFFLECGGPSPLWIIMLLECGGPTPLWIIRSRTKCISSLRPITSAMHFFSIRNCDIPKHLRDMRTSSDSAFLLKRQLPRAHSTRRRLSPSDDQT